uniref:Uncharacterized protein LOC8270919 n=1 Tax=Rhizophora mucronata TaxID=61149 RepID=A0A2P2J6J6_RHIMU
MEDNELWLRHFLGLGVQTGVALYIFILAWSGTRLSVIAIPMILAGLVKYGERTRVLRSASNEQFRDSMLTSPDPGPNYPKFMQEYALRQFEGFHVKAEEVIEAQVAVDVSSIGDSCIPDATELVIAFELFKTFKRLFMDLILSFQDRENSQSMFKEMSPEKAFKVVEIELGFMFDVLYTKAPVIYSSQGCILRFVSMSLTSIVLVVFSLFVADKEKYLKFDLVMTFALLAIAIVLEIYAVLLLLSSDWVDFYLSRHNKSIFGKAMAYVQLPKNPRWSNSLAQYSLLNFCLKTKPVICCTMLKPFCFDKILEKQQYKTLKEVSPDIKEMIFDQLKKKFKETFETGRDNQSSDEGLIENSSSEKDLKGQSLMLKKFGKPELTWSMEFEFDQSILIWHIATELCYHTDHQGTIMSKCKMSKQLSRYMLYLLVMHPSMLPMGIGNIRYRDTCAEAARFFQERKSILGDDQFDNISSLGICSLIMNWIRKGKTAYDKSQACKMLLKVNTAVPPAKVKGDRSKSVLFDACRLTLQLQDIPNKEAKWER